MPAAALGGAAVAALVLVVMPAASPSPQASPPSATASVSVAVSVGGQVEEPDGPDLLVGAVTPGYGAARSGAAGVPLGFAHSPDGAAAAATAWLSTVEGSGVLDTRRQHDVLAAIGDAVFVAATGPRLADRAAALGVDASGQPATGYVAATVWPSRGAYRVLSYGPNATQIEIWHSYQLEVVPAGAQAGPGRWRRATISLGWNKQVADWRITADFRFVDGPDPLTATPSRLERAEALARLGVGWRSYADAQQ